MTTPSVPDQHQRLSDYLNDCQRAIKAALPGNSWIVAELSSFKITPKGHTYLDIIDSEDGKEIAKARATMFAPIARSVLAKWKEATGGQPEPGMKLLMQVKADFSVQYGFSLQVRSIDPTYTLGEMQLQVKRVIEALKAKGLYDLQRSHVTPRSFWRVAVISPHEAAGLADFRRDADLMDAAAVCRFEYFSAVFQGRDSSSSIRAAMKAAHERHTQEAFDVLCIIRGGGSKADLAWLNEGNLAAWACRFPVPVFTGIGHEIDETVLDLVAHRRFDTPSKVIGFLKARLQEEHATAVLTMEKISQGLMRTVTSQRALIQQAIPQFSERSRRILSTEERRLARTATGFGTSAARLITAQLSSIQQRDAEFVRRLQQKNSADRLRLQACASGFAAGAQALLVGQGNRLAMVSTLFDKTNPLMLLSKGFALVRDREGRLVTTARDAHEGQRLSLTFADGVVDAVAEASGEEPQTSLAL